MMWMDLTNHIINERTQTQNDNTVNLHFMAFQKRQNIKKEIRSMVAGAGWEEDIDCKGDYTGCGGG